MGIRFRCHACEKKLNVKSFLGGKRGICPHCGSKIAIPPAEGVPPVSADAGSADQVLQKPSRPPSKAAQARPGGSAAVETIPNRPASQPAPTVSAPLETRPAAVPRDAFAEAPGAVWYVRPPSGGQYGPASEEYMRRWIEEGRVSGDSLVWRDGWADWQPAATVLAGLLPAGASTVNLSQVPQPTLDMSERVVTGEGSGIARRGRRRTRRSASRFTLALVIGLCLLTVGLLFALVTVLMG